MAGNEINPNDLPWDISDVLGDIQEARQFCSGVYYVFLYVPFEDETEFYLVDRDTHSVSDAAKSYGHPAEDIPSCLLYPCGTEIKGRGEGSHDGGDAFLNQFAEDLAIGTERISRQIEGLDFIPLWIRRLATLPGIRF